MSWEFLQTDWFGRLARVGLVLLIVVVGRRLVSRFIQHTVRKAIRPDKHASARAEKAREDTLINIFDHILKVSIWLIGAVIILSTIGVNVAPLIAVGSILGIAVGFGGQSLVKDFFAGIFIVLENQYRIGDSVNLAGVSGTVESINIRRTVLRDMNGTKHCIPNGEIKVCSNQSIDFSYVNLDLPVDYGTNIDKAVSLINEVGAKLAEIEANKKVIIEAPAFVRVNHFGPNAVELKVVGKVKPGQQWQVAGQFRRAIKKVFDRRGIVIPHDSIVVRR